MTMSREDMLRELELLPAWKLREPLPFTPAPKILVAKEEPPVIEVTEAVKVIESVEVMEPVLESELVSHAVEKQENVSLLEERINIIMQMDWQRLQSHVQERQFGNVAANPNFETFGAGDANADLLIVGEVPDTEEDCKDELIVGQVSQLLSNMLNAIQLKRNENVYISNVLVHRLAGFNDVLEEDATECVALLKRQVELIQPKLIIALGKVATQSLLQSSAITDMRGQLYQYNGVPVIVTYHPAYLLRNLADKAKAWEDLCFARKTMQNL